MFQYDDSEIVPVYLSVCQKELSVAGPTVVIDASMERSSRVLQHGNPKNLIFKKVDV